MGDRAKELNGFRMGRQCRLRDRQKVAVWLTVGRNKRLLRHKKKKNVTKSSATGKGARVEAEKKKTK